VAGCAGGAIARGAREEARVETRMEATAGALREAHALAMACVLALRHPGCQVGPAETRHWDRC